MTLLAHKQTIHLNNSDKYYKKLDNDTLRVRIDGDPLTAKDLLLDALTCREDWLFTTENMAKRHCISEKKAQRLLSRLVNSGYAERCRVADPKTGKIIMWHYIFYESPLDKKCPEDKNVQPVETKEENTKKSTGQKLSRGTYNNKHKEETTLKPPPKSDPPDEKHLTFEDQNLAIADGLKKLRSKIPKIISPNLSNTFLTNGIIKHGIEYMLWLADQCKGKPNELLFFCKGVHNREQFNKFDRLQVRQGEGQAQKDKQKRANDDMHLGSILKGLL